MRVSPVIRVAVAAFAATAFATGCSSDKKPEAAKTTTTVAGAGDKTEHTLLPSAELELPEVPNRAQVAVVLDGEAKPIVELLDVVAPFRTAQPTKALCAKASKQAQALGSPLHLASTANNSGLDPDSAEMAVNFITRSAEVIKSCGSKTFGMDEFRYVTRIWERRIAQIRAQ